MPTLSPELGVARRTLDYRATVAMRSPILASVRAFAAGSKTPLGPEDGERGKAMVYLVEYALKFLTGPGTYANRVTVRFDLALSSDYPITPPDATVVSTPKPWSPHVLAPTGSICIGEIWKEANGKMLVAHLVSHIARVFNCDETDRGAGYVGWNAEAVLYWRSVMKRAPVTSGLVYPVPPADITHPGRPSTSSTAAVGLSGGASGVGLRRAVAGLKSMKSLGSKP